MKPGVEATDLFRVYATREGRAAALQGLTLEVAQGEIVVVFGPSGSGKTTFLRILAGLELASAGRVRVLGVDLRKVRGRQRDRFRAAMIGFADQHYSRLLAPELRVEEIVELPLALGGEGRRFRRARVAELLDRVGLAERARAHSRELSGGEQQRVALCAAMAHRPPLLLADEPTGELDATTAAGIYGLIGELVRDHRGTAVIVSHDPGSTTIADRVVQLRDGRISAETLAGGEESIVVGRAGWLRVPEELLARSLIRARARPAVVDGRLTLTSADEPVPAEPGAMPSAPARRTRPLDHGAVAELRAVERRFGGESGPAALEDITARFSSQRLTAISGPSGSGKTTLLHLLAGLDLPTRGEVLVLDTVISRLDRASRAAFRRNRIALVAQDPPLVPFLTAEENVELALNVRGGSPNEVGRRSGDALAAVGLGGLAEQRVDRLSMGERQRVAIARAVSSEPKLLLADEPTARLDQANAAAFGELLTHLVDALGLSVIFSTHDAVLLNVADEVFEL
jgi:ABC-type lipoprotein export system ATPase subunit